MTDSPLFHGEGVPLPEGSHHSELKRLNPADKAKPDTAPLNQMDLWGRSKAEIAIQRLQEYEPEDGYYVAFSGGKDSIVALDLVQKAGVKHDAHFRVMGGMDPPENIAYIKRHWVPRGVQMDHPVDPWNPDGGPLTIWKLIPYKLSPPTQARRFCCYYLKEPGGDGRCIVTGVRWAESHNRRSRRVVEQCYAEGRGRMFVNPIIDWTDQDVWDYIKQEGLPVPPIYGEPYILDGKPLTRKDGTPILRTRLGCIMCPMQDAQKMKCDAERWPKHANAYKRACQKALDRRFNEGKGRIPLDQLQWKTGQELFDWWLQGRPIEVKHAGQSLLDLELEDDEPTGCPLNLVNQGGVLGRDTAGGEDE